MPNNSKDSSLLGPHRKYPVSVKTGIPKIGVLRNSYKRFTIGELFKVKSRPVKMKDSSIYQLVTVKRSRGGVVGREKLVGDKISVKSQFYLKEGDFLISKRQIVHGACGFVPKSLNGSVVSNEYSVMGTTDIILPLYLNYLIHSPYFQQTCFHSSTGVHVEKMIFKLENWFKWEIDIPEIEEQRKIADCFFTLDKKLILLEKKHAQLVQYKKGLIQKLLSQKIRFKDEDGNKFPNWKNKQGNKIFDAVSNKNHNSDLPILAITQDKGAIPRELINYRVQVTANSIASYKVVEKGDFIISLRSFQGGIEYSNYKGICSPAYIILQPSIDICDDFYRYYLKTNNFIQEMKKRLEGIRDGKILSYKYFSEIKLPSPCIEEQQRIADFLITIDKKIDLVNQQIEQTQTFKKGLLQQMFV
jgi:type I restriction enzyme S subunit